MKKVFVIVSIIIGLMFSQNLFAQSQCKAITKKGTQCKRKATNNSEYCFQHKKNSSNTNVSTEETNKKKAKVNKSSSSNDTYNGNEIHTGPRGGRYYINKNGNKTYIKRK